jgi:hypothetical protein
MKWYWPVFVERHERQRLNAEAAERAAEHEREQRRLASGALSFRVIGLAV